MSHRALGPQFDLHWEHNDPDEGPAVHAYDHQGREVGHVFYEHPETRGVIAVGSMHVEPEHQRKGLNTAMTDLVLKKHPKDQLDFGPLEPDGKEFVKGYIKKRPQHQGRLYVENTPAHEVEKWEGRY